MSALSIQPTYPILTDIDGQPLENGFVWIGTANLDPQANPIAAYWDAALTQVATQPVRTRGGYPLNGTSVGRLYVNSDYSILVQNRNGATVYSAPAATERYSDVVINSISASEVTYTPGPNSLLASVTAQAALDDLSDDEDGSSYVGFLQAGTGASPTTVQAKLREIETPADFGSIQSNPLIRITGIQDRYNYVFNTKYNQVAGGNSNVIAGGGNGTSNNEILGATDYQTISGGYDNTIDGAIASTISGGAHHRIFTGTTHGTISGGSYNDIEVGDYGTIGGGTGHTVNGSNGTVAGGINNTAGADASVGGGSTNTATGRYAVVAGGTLNDVASQSGTVAGGDNNDITNADFSSVGGGYQNKLGHVSYSGNSSVIGGGYQNLIAQTAQAQYATIAGGRGNAISANYAAILGGQNNTASGSYSAVLGGNSAVASATYSVASGSSNAAHYGAEAHSSVSPATGGQRLQLTAARTTTDGTTSELLLDGSTIFLFIPDNTVWAINATVAATRTDSVGEYAMYDIEALIKRDSGAATTSVLASTVNTVFETTAAWAFSFSVSTSNGQVRFRPTGEVGKTIRWMATINITEVKTA